MSLEDVAIASHLGSAEAQAMGEGVTVLVGVPLDATVCHLVGLQRQQGEDPTACGSGEGNYLVRPKCSI